MSTSSAHADSEEASMWQTEPRERRKNGEREWRPSRRESWKKKKRHTQKNKDDNMEDVMRTKGAEKSNELHRTSLTSLRKTISRWRFWAGFNRTTQETPFIGRTAENETCIERPYRNPCCIDNEHCSGLSSIWWSWEVEILNSVRSRHSVIKGEHRGKFFFFFYIYDGYWSENFHRGSLAWARVTKPQSHIDSAVKTVYFVL